MTRCHCTSPLPPLPSSTRRRRRSIHDEDLDDDLSTIPDNYYDHRDVNSESDDEPLRRPSRKAMGKWASQDSFTSTLGKHGVATYLTPTSVRPLHSESWEVYIVSEEEDEREPAPLASQKISDYAVEWLNPPANVYI